jgi:glycine cleavage system aminomethyltransferase T
MNTPYRLTPLNRWHETHGARMAGVGGWRRVLHYGDANEEQAIAMSAVAICDVTPFSKIDVHGKQSGALVERACSSAIPDIGHSLSLRGSNQSSAAVRLIRLTNERFLLVGEPDDCHELTKSLESVADAISCAHVHDISSCYAAFLMFGPKTLALLSRLSPADIAGIPLTGCCQTPIARTAGILVRWHGGEPSGWLLLVSRDYGEYMWECVLAAGQDLGVCPIGVEAQRAITAGGCP